MTFPMTRIVALAAFVAAFAAVPAATAKTGAAAFRIGMICDQP
jgi:hypothetical protein